MNKLLKNPFDHDAANNLSDEEIIDYYIEDYNFSRFIRSTKNVFLIGERGSGKTMTLLYNSFKIQHKIALNDDNISYKWIGIHIPCNTPLFHKREYLLIEDEYKKSIICEHYLVLSILYAIANTLSTANELVDQIDSSSDELYTTIEYIWDIQLERSSNNFFEAVKKFVNKEIIRTQKEINSRNSDSFYDNALSFSSTVLPFLLSLTQIACLKDAHYMLMIDDAHDMNEYQIKTLNSWIAYRDHSLFSFKVATIKVGRPARVTSTGGSILEGHDFITVDMEQAYQNEKTSFYHLSKLIVERRLEKAGINVAATEFFPVNKDFEKQLEKYRQIAQEQAQEKYGDNAKAISDYIYKYQRALYFRDRKAQANHPPYSGFRMIVAVSTGIIRNMLDPCYWMYESAFSEQRNKNNDEGIISVKSISPAIQNDTICKRSKDFWAQLEQGLENIVPNCTQKESKQVYNLLEQLIVLFSKRIKAPISEPRAIVFSISQKEKHPTETEKLLKLINIARRAQYIYTRIGNAKDLGKSDILYVPNRIIFPNFGLDPDGQFARVSLKVTDLYAAAIYKKEIPFGDDGSDAENIQLTLFDL